MKTIRLASAACIGAMGVALLAGDAAAFTHEECLRMPANQYLAAIERGVCEINFETAAGPQQASMDDGDGGRDGRGDGNHGGSGGRTGGGGKTGGGNPGRGNPGKP